MDAIKAFFKTFFIFYKVALLNARQAKRHKLEARLEKIKAKRSKAVGQYESLLTELRSMGYKDTE